MAEIPKPVDISSAAYTAGREAHAAGGLMLRPPPDVDPATPAARAAHVRHRLALAGIRQPCRSCGAPALAPCRRTAEPFILVRGGPPVAYDGGPVVCKGRMIGRESLAEMALNNAIILCGTDEDYSRLHADLEPVRLAHFADVDLGPAPIWIGHMRAPAASVGAS